MSLTSTNSYYNVSCNKLTCNEIVVPSASSTFAIACPLASVGLPSSPQSIATTGGATTLVDFDVATAQFLKSDSVVYASSVWTINTAGIYFLSAGLDFRVFNGSGSGTTATVAVSIYIDDVLAFGSVPLSYAMGANSYQFANSFTSGFISKSNTTAQTIKIYVRTNNGTSVSTQIYSPKFQLSKA